MFKIIEGTAAHIEEEGNKLRGYDLDTIQFTTRNKIYIDDEHTVSDTEYNFYIAVFKSISWE